MFDLEQEIGRWRERIAHSESFSPDHVTELESHLRDSVDDLQSRDLSAEEAFMVATKRLGSARELKQEFSKENLATLWSARLMWILVGMVFVKLGIGFYLFASRGAGETVLALTNSARFAGLTIMATKAFLIGIVVYEAWYFLTEKDQRRLRAMDSAFNWAFTHPVQTLAALFTIAILPASVGLLHLLDANAIVHHLLIGNLQPFKVHFSQFVFPMVVMPLAKLSLVLGLAYWIYHRQSGNSITA